MSGRTIEILTKALEEIRDMHPEPFDFPRDLSQQIASCGECARYKKHPIQKGICDEHRRPIWARERHDKDELARMAPRARTIASKALAEAMRPDEQRVRAS